MIDWQIIINFLILIWFFGFVIWSSRVIVNENKINYLQQLFSICLGIFWPFFMHILIKIYKNNKGIDKK